MAAFMRNCRAGSYVAALQLWLAVCAGVQACAHTIRTDDGLVDGTTALLSDVTAFKGIPYAAAPLGVLRWRPPAPVVPWRGVLKANTYGSICPQKASRFDPSDQVDTSPGSLDENCLFLNIWKPRNATPASRLPVLVWIHGGAFVSGAGSFANYDGSAFAHRGIVLVTINYRIGALGFLAHPALTAEQPNHASGDYGLQDQIAALHWVRRNIAGFGGNPDRVTIAGHSAGGVSVGDLLVSPLSRGLFAGAIEESGPIEGITPPTRTLAEGEAIGRAAMAARGAQNLQTMRGLPVAALLQTLPNDPKARSPWTPLVDGHTMIAMPADRFVAGQEAHVPLIIGVAADESGGMGSPLITSASYMKSLQTFFGDDAAKVAALYPHATQAEATDAHRLILRDPMYAAAQALASCHARTGTSSFLYFMDHAPPGPLRVIQGAYHGAELAYVFDNLQFVHRPWTDEDRRFAITLQSYWVNFVKTGNPNGTGLAQWPIYKPGGRAFRLGTGGAETPQPDHTHTAFYFPNLDPHVHPLGQARSGGGCG